MCSCSDLPVKTPSCCKVRESTFQNRIIQPHADLELFLVSFLGGDEELAALKNPIMETLTGFVHHTTSALKTKQWS